MASSSSQTLEAALERVQQQLGRKASFEEGLKRLALIVEQNYASALPEQQREIFTAVRRVGTLLQTRYTSRGFWTAGLRLFSKTQPLVCSQLEMRQLRGFIDQAKEIIGEERPIMEEPTNTAFAAPMTGSPFLFEGQLSAGATPTTPAWLMAQTVTLSLLSEQHVEPPHPDQPEERNVRERNRGREGEGERASEESLNVRGILDEFLRAEELNRQDAGTGSMEEADDRTVDDVHRNSDHQSGAIPSEEVQPEITPTEQDDADMHQNAENSPASNSVRSSPTSGIGRQRGQRMVRSGSENSLMDNGLQDEQNRQRATEARRRLQEMLSAWGRPVPDYLQVMRAAMLHAHGEDIPGLQEALDLTMQAPPKGPPPASKEEVAKLPRKHVTAELSSKLGPDLQCIVCREAFAKDELMLEMECKHLFHEDCILPWLELHNSCPLCRFEMRTDDADYERAKEREKEAREERRGVENALREGEHMFM